MEDLSDHFLREVNHLLETRGLATAGWEEIALKEIKKNQRTRKVPNEFFLQNNFIPFVWNNVWGWGAEDLGYRLANAGYKVVLCNATNLYLDLAYDKDPKEPGLYWAGFVNTRSVYEFTPYDIFKCANVDRMGNPIYLDNYKDRILLTDSGQKNILGIQGQLWGERLKSAAQMEYMAFPRLLALAESAWAQQPEWATIEDPQIRAEKFAASWNEFCNCLGQRELPRLDYLNGGINYRIPPPGAVYEEGLLMSNVEFPGLTIRYTTDGSDPDKNSAIYSEPIAVSGTVYLKTFTTNNRSSRTTTILCE